MVRFLPPQPNLDHLKNEAKALQKARRKGDSEACQVLRHVSHLGDASDEEIASADVPLSEVQFALAMEYGFASWQELRDVIVGMKPPENYEPQAHGDAMILPNPPAGTGEVNRLAAALHLALSYLGAPADPTTVAGDSGRAFILQADSLHRPYGADIKQLDIGWWPVDHWGVMLRLDALGRAYGIPMREIPASMAEYKADPALHYRKYYEAEVTQSLRAGRPVVAVCRDICVVFGFDGGNPPLLAQVACKDKHDLQRVAEFPWTVVLLGEPSEPMERRQADAESLDFAVRLSREEIDLSHLPGKSTGRRSWELWLSQIRDAELCGPHFYHANVVGCLRQDRRSAVSYLRTMADRHDGDMAAHLVAAAGIYGDVLGRLGEADTSKDVMADAAGRDALATVVEAVAQLEVRAVGEMAQALRAMG